MLLSDEEWRQIDYLLHITEPFFYYTTELSKTRDVTVHLVFKIYNALFKHLEQLTQQLRRKRVYWKQHMLESLEAGRAKLGEYYSQTDNVKGHVFAISTMLAPDNRFQFFQSDDWDSKWRTIYRHAFATTLAPYQERLSNPDGSLSTDTSAKPRSLFRRLNQTASRNKIRSKPATGEISQYLDSDITKEEPLQFWKAHQGRFPAIASLARDILSIPATRAGVERLFNTARDICHYRRGRMKFGTIEELMLFLCASRFDLKAQEARELEAFFTVDEIEALKEQKEDKSDDIEVRSISDTEEVDQGSGESDLIDVHDEPELPENTPVRVSGRKRKAREDDDFVMI